MPNRHYCSDGSQVTQATIDRKYAEARADKYAGYTAILPCEACGAPSVDNDHTIAQARCKVIHKTELIWHPDNFPRSCRTCHKQWESYKSGDWINHNNVEERLAFLKEHDPEGFRIRIELTKINLEE